MKIGIIGSMQFTEKMLEVKHELQKLGHKAFLTDLHKSMIGKNNEEIEVIKLKQKYEHDAIKEFWNMMQGADAVLVLNYEKNGIKNYIGANTFLEMGFAHVLGQKIFLFNDPPKNPYLETEIIALKPIIISGDLKKISHR
jgi:hypothetical protein